MTLYEHLPVDIRGTVDALVLELKPQPWPTRFLAMIGLLGEKLEARTEREPWNLIQQWTALVTATLEHLQPDSSAVECLGLMSISLNGNWALRRSARSNVIPRCWIVWSQFVLTGKTSSIACWRPINGGRSRRHAPADRNFIAALRRHRKRGDFAILELCDAPPGSAGRGIAGRLSRGCDGWGGTRSS